MQCPFCNREMELGLVQSGKLMVWVKKKHYLSLRPKNNEILLDENLLSGVAVPAWLCRSCQNILIQYGNNEETEF